MASPNQGSPVKGEVSSADATAPGVTLLLYPAGSATAITLGATEFLTITDFWFNTTAPLDVYLATDSDADGKRIFKGSFEALGGIGMNLSVPITCPMGVTPVLIADGAGQVDLTLTGYITKA